MHDRLKDCVCNRILLALLAGAALAAVLAAGGCLQGGDGGWDWSFNRSQRNVPPPPSLPPPQTVASFDDTIGAYGEVPVDQAVLVRGYGLVKLPRRTGSRECPVGIRKHIASQLHRMRVGETNSALEGMTIDQWIDSTDTAAVEVRGLMPASGLRNETFDVMVSALPGSQTTSLEGGVLITTELSVWRRGVSGGLVTGKVMAMASGPIFINPFADSGNGAGTSQAAAAAPSEHDAEPGRPVGTPVDFRRGLVLGGGLILRDQPLQLILREPDYSVANVAMQQLNGRFPSPYLHGVAHATLPNLIELKVPPEYRTQVNYWLALVRQVYLRREPGFLEERTTQLVREISDDNVSDPQRLRCALTFAAIGKPCLPVIQPLYSNPRQSVAFHAVYAGLRIGDSLALRIMLEIAKQKDHPYRRNAVVALGQPHPFIHIGPHLAELLDEKDIEIRTAAYDSMCRLGAAHIEAFRVGQGNRSFRLDVVRSKGPYLIYVMRADEPRIVLFGGDTMRLNSPVFLANERTGVTLSADGNDEHVSISRVDPASNRLMVVKLVQAEQVADSQPDALRVPRMLPVTEMRSSLMLGEIIRRLGGEAVPDLDRRELQGMGLNYSQVVHVLYQLEQNRGLPCRLHLQQLSRANVDLAADGPALPDSATIEREPGLPAEDEPAGTDGMIIQQPAGRPRIGS